MSNNLKFGACLPVFDSCADRYVLSGYGKKKTLEELFLSASEVEDLRGIELVGNWHINEANFDFVKSLLERTGLEVAMVVPDLWTQGKWGLGSFTSKGPKVRDDAIKEVKKTIDMALALNCNRIDLWFGQDGYDYSFQANFPLAWKQLVEGVQECADYNPNIDICIEYKLKEPRAHLFINSAAKTLLLIERVNRENVGALLDVGHALAAQENTAEAASLLAEEGKLFYVHLNDNYRLWDDDMMVGSVHIIEYLELLYWLKRYKYQGWYTLDIFPYREDGIKAAKESIKWIKGLMCIVEQIGEERIGALIDRGDATEISGVIRTALIK
ncbi:sugar phosphate isomerase/epimerase [bacterium]|nr:sugar phosphate isomerase/epimerase [bacterium]